MRHGQGMRRGRVVLALWAAIAAGTGVGRAAPAAAPAVALVPVQLPITGTRDTQVEAAILRQLDRLRGEPQQRGVLVLRFDAAGDEADGSDFGRALELARFLTDGRLAGVKTVAWLPRGASGHAVLVALACEEIVLPADAVLGPAAPAGANAPADEATRAAYRQVASARRVVPPAAAVAFVDRAARVLRVSTDAGEQFVAPGDLPALQARATVLAVEELAPVPLALDGRRGRQLGFVARLARTPAELAAGLGVSAAAVAGDPAAEGGWRPVQLTLSGAVSADTVARLRSRADRALAGGANLLCLRIDSDGGAPEQSLVLANWLADLDRARVRTVAYVPRQARGDAALVAAACDELVMHPGAVLGGEGAAAIGPRQAEALVAAWRGGVARARERPWSLPLALAVPGLELRRAVERGSGRVECFTAAELAARDDAAAWETGAVLGTGPLALDGRRAQELGLAAHLVDDVGGLKRAYGLETAPALAEPTWADRLLEALASPGLAWLLLLIGGAGLFIELKTPGVGFGGFVALVAFIIYFWSQHLHGTSGWLEVMLFVAGLVCLAAEIFVLPGFGVLGLGGGLLVIAALVLASQSFVLPANDYQIRQMQWSLAGILGAAVGVATLAWVLRRWLPATPLLRDVLLAPPAPAADREPEPLNALVGEEGTTTTRLAPAGKARIGGRLHDVASDGVLVEPGTVVRVVEVRGGRVIVRPVGPA